MGAAGSGAWSTKANFVTHPSGKGPLARAPARGLRPPGGLEVRREMAGVPLTQLAGLRESLVEGRLRPRGVNLSVTTEQLLGIRKEKKKGKKKNTTGS